MSGHAVECMANEIDRVVGVMANSGRHCRAGLYGPDATRHIGNAVMKFAYKRAMDVAAQDQVDSGFGPRVDISFVTSQQMLLIDSVRDVNGLMRHNQPQLILSSLFQALRHAFNLCGRHLPLNMSITARRAHANSE